MDRKFVEFNSWNCVDGDALKTGQFIMAVTASSTPVGKLSEFDR